ncbi:MAG: N(4)-(beta-N-acetylglucosaminyl)-L-asparaginase [Bacteroidota bacterium]
MSSRRGFLSRLALLGAGIAASPLVLGEVLKKKKSIARNVKPIVISTWDHGVAANDAAMQALKSGGDALDMAEKGVYNTESDLKNLSVGLGGLPDRDGITTLDASIMDYKHRAGSVACVSGYAHPISIARGVLEKTPHAMLVGEGAEQFAASLKYEKSSYTNPEAQKAWKEWLKTSEYKPIINIENHDTIGLLAQDSKGQLAGACTTSGLAFKMHGRVGDSPIIGAGLYVDNEIGAATCTGLGETVIRSCTSFLVVELMRQGASPQEACEEAIKRLYANNSFMTDEYQVGVLALRADGEFGAFGLRKGFTYAICENGKNELKEAKSLI